MGRGGDGPSLGLICCGVCCLASIITLIVVLAISFQQLDQLDLALDYNSITLQVSETVYGTAGLFMLGPGHWFIRYKKTVQLVDFVASGNGASCSNCDGYEVLTCRTSDGLPVSMSLSFQFRYDEARLRDLYLQYKEEHYVCDDYEDFFNCRGIYQDKARSTISNVATNFSAFSFFNDKSNIASAMQMEVTRVFDQELMAKVEAFQITRIELPAQFQNAILESIEAKQNITYSLQYKENMAVTFQTEILVANQTRYQTIALAGGTANQRYQQAEATASVVEQTVLAEMYAYGNLSTAVELDTKEGLDYIWWSEQEDIHGKNYLVGLNPQSYIRGV